jgi:hypothetical protein
MLPYPRVLRRHQYGHGILLRRADAIAFQLRGNGLQRLRCLVERTGRNAVKNPTPHAGNMSGPGVPQLG